MRRLGETLWVDWWTGLKPSSYFIDESGHSGDLASAKGLDFANQPVFALACIGVTDEAELAAELDRLRAVHRCGAGELKSSMAALPGFVTDLADYFEARDCPIFIELVDKRYFIAIHVVCHLLCGGADPGRAPIEARIAISEFLTDAGADAILLDYMALCREPRPEAIRPLLDKLWDWLDASDEEAARDAQILTMEARDRLSLGETTLDGFLPLADLSETNRQVWMLPNLTSLAHIYGRINHSRPDRLEGVTLVHHQQLQYGGILERTKQLMEQLARDGNVAAMPFADYDLSGAAELRFSDFVRDPCLQAADLLAGCAMRYARDMTSRRRRSDPELRRAFVRLLGLTEESEGRGIHLVFTDAALEQMDVPVFRLPDWLVFDDDG